MSYVSPFRLVDFSPHGLYFSLLRAFLMGCQILWIIPCGDFIFIPGNACLQRYSRTWLSCLETVIFLDLTLSFVWWDQSCIYSRFNFPHNPSNILLSTVAGALWITRFFSLGGGHRLYFWPSVACRCCSLWSLQVVLPLVSGGFLTCMCWTALDWMPEGHSL